jgi:hypothetical protein
MSESDRRVFLVFLSGILDEAMKIMDEMDASTEEEEVKERETSQ